MKYVMNIMSLEVILSSQFLILSINTVLMTDLVKFWGRSNTSTFN